MRDSSCTSLGDEATFYFRDPTYNRVDYASSFEVATMTKDDICRLPPTGRSMTILADPSIKESSTDNQKINEEEYIVPAESSDDSSSCGTLDYSLDSFEGLEQGSAFEFDVDDRIWEQLEDLHLQRKDARDPDNCFKLLLPLQALLSSLMISLIPPSNEKFLAGTKIVSVQ